MASDTTPPVSAGPGRPGLSFDVYKQAYHELTSADGTPPSQRQLRKYLGTGSNTTLAGYRRRIAEERLVDDMPVEPRSIDSELLATVQRLATQIAMDEAQLADDRVDEIKKESDSRIRVAESTMEKRLQDTALLEYRATQAEKDLASLRATMAEKEAALSSLTATHQVLKEDHAVLNHTLSDAKQQIATQTRKLLQMENALEAANKAEKNAIRNSMRESAKQQEAYSALQEKLSKSNSELNAITATLAKLTEEHTEQSKAIDTLIAQQQAVQTRLSKTAELREETLAQLQAVTQQREILSVQCAELSSELNSEKRRTQDIEYQLTHDAEEKANLIAHLQKTVTALSQATGKRS